ncbi:MAG TPA: hypothetical protein VH393_04695 [Ktedonobacterales bacterium]|jgi:hypothetical protein
MRQSTSQSRAPQEQGALTQITRFFSRQAVKVTLLVGLSLALAGSVAPLATTASTAGAPVAVHPYPWGCGGMPGPC